MDNSLALNKNELVAYLKKPASQFTKEDIKRFIAENDIDMVNFMYPGGDGRLKTLNFVVNDLGYLDEILSCGERVDGSSLSPLSRQAVATCMSSRDIVRLLLIRLLRRKP